MIIRSLHIFFLISFFSIDVHHNFLEGWYVMSNHLCYITPCSKDYWLASISSPINLWEILLSYMVSETNNVSDLLTSTWIN